MGFSSGVLLNEKTDISWLFETHLKGIRRWPWLKSFEIWGNEDAPRKIGLYELRYPLVITKPRITVEFDDYGMHIS